MDPLPEIVEGECPEWTNTNKSMLTELLPTVWDDATLKNKDPFGCKLIDAIKPCLEVPDEPGILVPSLFALRQW
jgi:hypothetical protein